MSTTPFLQQVADAEPWRLGVGQPRNALDPTWVPGLRDNLCNGDIDWEGATGWWICQSCGYIGSCSYTGHRPVFNPLSVFLRGLSFFVSQRAVSTPPNLLVQQMLFISGVALRYAAIQQRLAAFATRMEAA